jgi:tetratricopeptide (TPR) repeat protein
VSTSEKCLIAETEHVVAIEQDMGGEFVIVTFNGMGLVRNGLTFWGDRFLLKTGYSAVGIVTACPNWYPRGAMEEILPAVRARIAGRKVITYGHSQGGYGALKYAHALGASVALSFCPQYSIASEYVGSFDPRFLTHCKVELQNGLPVETHDLCPTSYIFYDPYERLDGKNVALLQGLRDSERRVHCVQVPFTGHKTVQLVAEGGMGAALIKAACSIKAPTPEELRSLLRQARRSSGTYRSAKTVALIMRHRIPPVFLERELQYCPESFRPFGALVCAAMKSDTPQARKLLTSMVDDQVLAFEPVVVWTLFRAIDFREGESRIAEIMLSRYPTSAFMRMHAIISMIRMGRNVAAHDELRNTALLAGAGGVFEHVLTAAKQLRAADVLESMLVSDVYADALSVKDRRLEVTLELLSIYWRSNNFEAGVAAADRIDPTLLLDRRYLDRVIGGNANNVSSDYGFQLFDQFLKLPRTDHSVSRLELLDRLARKDPRSALQRLEGRQGELLRQPEDWQYASIIYQRSGDLKKALACQRLAIKRDRQSAVFKVRMVELNMVAGKRNLAALGLYRLSLHNSDPTTFRPCAELALKLRRCRLALFFADKLRMQNSDSQEVAMLLARCHHARKDHQRSYAIALEVLANALRGTIVPESLWGELVTFLHSSREPGQARIALREGLKRFPGNRSLRDLETRMTLLSRFPASGGQN